MLNWRGYRALGQNSGRHWRARCPHAIDRALSQSVSRETSYVGLWAQPINGSGDDRGLCTTPLDTLHPIHRIGNRIARDARWESSGDDFASERNVQKNKAKKEKEKARDSRRSTSGKRWKIVREKHSLLYRICMLRMSYNPRRASPTRPSVRVESNILPLIKVSCNRVVSTRQQISGSYFKSNIYGRNIYENIYTKSLRKSIIVNVFLDSSIANAFLNKLSRFLWIKSFMFNLENDE